MQSEDQIASFQSLLPLDHSKRVTDAAEILDSEQVDYVHLPVNWLATTQADVDQFV